MVNGMLNLIGSEHGAESEEQWGKWSVFSRSDQNKE